MGRSTTFWVRMAGLGAAVTAVTAVAVSILVGGWPPTLGAERGRALYARHCAACHGEAGEGRVRGNATALNNSDFLAVASDRFLEVTIARGRRETEMAAWAADAGGPLTGREIRAIVAFVRGWQEPQHQQPSVPRLIQGEPARGGELYATACANCHGWEGCGQLGMGPAVTNPDLLAAADDAFLWATIAYGRRDTPMFPSLRGLSGVRQLSEQDVSDLVAYLRSHQDERREAVDGARLPERTRP